MENESNNNDKLNGKASEDPEVVSDTHKPINFVEHDQVPRSELKAETTTTDPGKEIYIFSGNIGDLSNPVTLLVLLLSIVGVLDLLSRFFHGLHRYGLFRTFFSFFGIYSDESIREEAIAHAHKITKVVYNELGYRKSFTELQVTNSWWKDGNLEAAESEIRVLAMICEHIQHYKEKLHYGSHNKEKSSYYYINTMEAAIDQEDRRIFCDLLFALMNKTGHRRPDFVIVPKDGNVLLAASWPNIGQCPALIARGKRDRARASLMAQAVETEPGLILQNGVVENFEGLRGLFPRAQKDEKLHGFVIDCNTSGGSNIRDIIVDFNKQVAEKMPQISPIEHAFVLFKIDSSGNLDTDAKRNNYVVHRFFDMKNEDDTKSKLWKLKQDMQKGSMKETTFHKRLNEILSEVERR